MHLEKIQIGTDEDFRLIIQKNHCKTQCPPSPCSIIEGINSRSTTNLVLFISINFSFQLKWKLLETLKKNSVMQR